MNIIWKTIEVKSSQKSSRSQYSLLIAQETFQPRSQGLSSLPLLVVGIETLVAAVHVTIYLFKTGGWVCTFSREFSQQIFLPPRFWVVTWPAATRVPTTKGSREERPWERGWKLFKGLTRYLKINNSLVTRQFWNVFWVRKVNNYYSGKSLHWFWAILPFKTVASTILRTKRGYQAQQRNDEKYFPFYTSRDRAVAMETWWNFSSA